MKKSVEILGLPIISITEGRELGMSKTLRIDAQNGQVAAITIEDDDWYRGVKLIPYESVIAIGEDAVTITHSENILNLDEAGDYENLLIENIRVIGTKAIKIYEDALNLPSVKQNDEIRREFIKNVEYQRVVRDVLLKHQAATTPFAKLPKEILQEIDAELQKTQLHSSQYK